METHKCLWAHMSLECVLAKSSPNSRMNFTRVCCKMGNYTTMLSTLTNEWIQRTDKWVFVLSLEMTRAPAWMLLSMETVLLQPSHRYRKSNKKMGFALRTFSYSWAYFFIVIGLTQQIKLTYLTYNTPNERSWNELSSRTLSQHTSSNQSCILWKYCWN